MTRSVAQPREEVMEFFEQLAEIIDLSLGDVRITVSNSRIVKIGARPDVQACCVELKKDSWVTRGEEIAVQIGKGPNSIDAHIAALIVDLVGGYGYMEACIEEGEVAVLLIYISRRPSARRSGRGRFRSSPR